MSKANQIKTLTEGDMQIPFVHMNDFTLKALIQGYLSVGYSLDIKSRELLRKQILKLRLILQDREESEQKTL